ncbi:hypothetical protein PZA22_17185 [Pectobacterium polaris]|uniref:hypothetical protein n=1 Tax=Pectobacterium polaris TaxID=2042057 RepID=UPI00202D8AA8|nr:MULTISPECIES: hypothetical protein [Pectobacterium]MCL6339282.1 hypothetical protein [Pectobacterium carotovorum subsp. carotovorum]MCL6343541.1 hypothetical protein [Pectobacterium carotovorum subsp. carotovorum]MDE8756222.1 hypothetical protein [Pectobacterium polaris]GKX37589.1 hypothetical protein SOASR014_13280 [Pectobacterium carotovorum subsp. carotovorum]GLX44213.1 hypothetical protein Pcaca01_18810 [Pectobacterium carotovorum subsp. carotovorum]
MQTIYVSSIKGGACKTTATNTDLSIALPEPEIIRMMVSELWHTEFHHIIGKSHGGTNYVSSP